jgi:hypothetical protein
VGGLGDKVMKSDISFTVLLNTDGFDQVGHFFQKALQFIQFRIACPLDSQFHHMLDDLMLISSDNLACQCKTMKKVARKTGIAIFENTRIFGKEFRPEINAEK